MKKVKTAILDIAFEDGGPSDGPVVLLLHGWPDDVRAWGRIAPALHSAGYRTIAPWLRGFGDTSFHSPSTLRDGRAVALAQDAIDLLDRLGVDRFSVVGHDWGARTAYSLAAICPERLDSVTALSLGYTPKGAFPVPSFEQSRRWWYQWFLTFDGGAQALAEDHKGFDRLQWDTWSPPGWFDDAEFEETAKSFDNPDWVAITLHGYRSRWKKEPCDERYRQQQERVEATTQIAVPTLLIQGGSDYCDPPGESEGLDRHFSGGYERVVIDGVGHFPTREAPDAVLGALLPHIGRNRQGVSVDLPLHAS